MTNVTTAGTSWRVCDGYAEYLQTTYLYSRTCGVSASLLYVLDLGVQGWRSGTGVQMRQGLSPYN